MNSCTSGKHRLLVWLLVMLFSPTCVWSTHTMGADITYTCLGTNAYEVKLTLFRDCSGILPVDPQSLNYRSAACGVNATIGLYQQSTVVDVTPLCPSQTSACAGGTSPFGIQQYTFTGNLTLPSGCNDWELSWSNCCRNAAITTLTGPNNQSSYITALLDNTTSPCNNSPVFNHIPTPIVCINEPVIYNHGVTDPDGDELRFSLTNCLQQNGNSVTYANGFNATSPLATQAGITIDSLTGEIRFVPNQVQIGVICVKVEEYRNGVKIGETVRDMQFSVINCNNAAPIASGINGDTADYEVNICIGGQACFDIDITDPDGDIVSTTWNQGIPGGLLTILNNGSINPQASFCWTPTLADTGAHFFTLTVEDDHCPLTGSATYAFTVNVQVGTNSLDVSPDTSICTGSQAALRATAVGPGPIQYEWRPALGLSDDTLATPIASPSFPQIYTVTATFGDGCTATDQVQVGLNSGPNVSVSPSVAAVCAGTVVTLRANARGGSLFQWPDGSTADTLDITVNSDTSFQVIASDGASCADSATANITLNSPGLSTCNVLYATPSGTGNGTQIDPANLVTAIDLANCTQTIIRLAEGTYTLDAPITNLSSYVILEGGYDPTTWQKSSQQGKTLILRSTLNPQGSPHAKRLSAFEIGFASFFRLQDLTIRVASPADSGTSAYGLHLTSCSDYAIVRCQIEAGNAANGVAGIDGQNGIALLPTQRDGTNGTQGAYDQDTDPGEGGNGGTGGGANGGPSGNGGLDPTTGSATAAGQDGQPGGNSGDYRSGGGGGGGGSGGEDTHQGGDGGRGGGINGANATNGTNGTGGASSNPGRNGSNGANGASGANGTSGTTRPNGSHVSGFWQPGAQAENGGDGQGGEGGGGGGGGGGQSVSGLGFDGAGNGGGGGGGGGEGGEGGTGGYGGGASYAIYLYNNGTNAQFVQCNLAAGLAGTGGAGGQGGTGATGGLGGDGNAVRGSVLFPTQVGAGGDGGDGGDGGNGGDGADGTDGESSSMYINGGNAPALTASDTSFNLTIQPEIWMAPIACTGISVDFSSSSSSTWQFGTDATPGVVAGSNVSTTYNATGYQDVQYASWTYAGFANIISDNTLDPLAATSAPQINGLYRICAGDSVNFEALNPQGSSSFDWDLDGGATPNTYNGSAYQTLPNIVFNTPGLYRIQLRYESECCGFTDPDTIELWVDTLPNLALSSPASLCAGMGGMALSASGGNAYQWSPAVGLDTTQGSSVWANPSSTTTYLVTALNQENTCYDTSSVTMTVQDLTLATQVVDAGCLPDGAASVQPSGGTGPYTYAWDTQPVVTDSVISNMASGTYEVVVTDRDGCQDSTYVSINLNPGSIDAFANSIIAPTCSGGTNGSAAITVQNAGTNLQYAWNPTISGAGASTGSVGAGSYSVTVTDLDNGCSTTTQLVIPEPAPIQSSLIATTAPDCNTYATATVNAAGGQGPYTYTWNTTPSQTGFYANNLDVGAYEVYIEDQQGCQDTLTFAIGGAQSPVVIDTIDATDASGCTVPDGTITVSAKGSNNNITYTWLVTPQVPGPTISNILPGGYTVRAVGANGCQDLVGITLGPNCPLDRHEVWLEARWTGEAAQLSWNSSYLQETSDFFLEKQSLQQDWELLHTQTWQPNRPISPSMTFQDKNLISQEILQYRVRQITQDGMEIISNVEQIQVPQIISDEIIRYGLNKTAQELWVEVKVHQPTVLEVRLFSNLGQDVGTKRFELTPGITKLYIDLHAFASGLYIGSFHFEHGKKYDIRFLNSK